MNSSRLRPATHVHAVERVWRLRRGIVERRLFRQLEQRTVKDAKAVHLEHPEVAAAPGMLGDVATVLAVGFSVIADPCT
jgi:hypothetical protein